MTQLFIIERFKYSAIKTAVNNSNEFKEEYIIMVFPVYY